MLVILSKKDQSKFANPSLCIQLSTVNKKLLANEIGCILLQMAMCFSRNIELAHKHYKLKKQWLMKMKRIPRT